MRIPSLDESEYARYLSDVRATDARKHVAHVAHLRAELEVGRCLVESFMSEKLFMQYATDVTTLPGFEAWLAGTLQKKKITLDKSVILVVTDFSKLGAAQQAIVNRHVAVIQSMTDRNPEGGNDWE